MDYHYHDQADDHQGARDQAHKHDGEPRRWEFARYDVLLALEKSQVAKKQHKNRNAKKRRTEGLPQVPNRLQCRVVCAINQRRVQSEELRDGDSDGGECE